MIMMGSLIHVVGLLLLLLQHSSVSRRRTGRAPVVYLLMLLAYIYIWWCINAIACIVVRRTSGNIAGEERVVECVCTVMFYLWSWNAFEQIYAQWLWVWWVLAGSLNAGYLALCRAWAMNTTHRLYQQQLWMYPSLGVYHTQLMECSRNIRCEVNIFMLACVSECLFADAYTHTNSRNHNVYRWHSQTIHTHTMHICEPKSQIHCVIKFFFPFQTPTKNREKKYLNHSTCGHTAIQER